MFTCNADSLRLCPTCGWSSQWSGWWWVTDCCVSSAHFLSEPSVQTEPSDCGSKAGTTSLKHRYMFRPDNLQQQMSYSTNEWICYLKQTSARCSLHTAMYIAEGSTVEPTKRKSTRNNPLTLTMCCVLCAVWYDTLLFMCSPHISSLVIEFSFELSDFHNHFKTQVKSQDVFLSSHFFSSSWGIPTCF